MDLQAEALRLMAEGITVGICTLASGRVVHLRDSDVIRLVTVIATKKLDMPVANAAASLVPYDLYLNGQIPIEAASRIDFDALERQINTIGEERADG